MNARGLLSDGALDGLQSLSGTEEDGCLCAGGLIYVGMRALRTVPGEEAVTCLWRGSVPSHLGRELLLHFLWFQGA